MVSLTYFVAYRSFEDNRFYGRLRSIPKDEEGLEIIYLRKELRKSEEKAKVQGNSKSVYYTRHKYNTS